MSVRQVGPYDVYIAVRERLLDRPSAEVRLIFEPGAVHEYVGVMTPDFARKLSRRLKKYADLADPPKPRRSRP